MQALILNSGVGKRMGAITEKMPKCMTNISDNETLISRQLSMLYKAGLDQVIITTGPFENVLREYVLSLGYLQSYIFVPNPVYDKSNYIYSIYLADKYISDDVLLLHGDLVFEQNVLDEIAAAGKSSMTISTTETLPQKDFKAVIQNRRIVKIGVDFFDSAVAGQPLYKLMKKDWHIWMDKITEYCHNGMIDCYAENAFNDVSKNCEILPLDILNKLCKEIDTLEDLREVKARLGNCV